MTDSELNLQNYWQKHKYEIANDRGWDCRAGCSGADTKCLKNCAEPPLRERHSNTLHSYDNFLALLSPYLPGTAISELTLFDLRRAMRLMQQKGGSRGPYASSTMRSVLSCLCDIFRFAQKNGHAYNVLAFYGRRKSGFKEIYGLIDPTKSEDEQLIDLEAYSEKLLTKMKSLTIWQRERLVELLIEGIEHDGRYLGLAQICYEGNRPAEARGTFFADVKAYIDHPDRHYLSIYQIRDSNGTLKPRTKTDNACRNIPAHIEYESLLARRKKFVSSQWDGDIEDLPTCCMENRFDQPCKDYQLANLADELFEKIKLTAADLLPFQVEQSLKHFQKGSETQEDANEALTLYALRRNFWTCLASSTQTTDFEKRLVMGHDMKVDGKSRRKYYNDETILWEIGQKMDRAVFHRELHRQSITQQVKIDKPVQFENRGVCLLQVPQELLLTGGTLYIEMEAEEAGDAILMDILSGKRALGQPTIMEVTGWPASSRDIVGINCEFENWLAHQKPVAPAARSKVEK